MWISVDRQVQLAALERLPPVAADRQYWAMFHNACVLGQLAGQ
jgi:hypothetical protein